MAQEAGYQRQVAQRSAAVPLASPDDFGAQVGRGIEQLGGALHRRDIDAYKIERQQAADAEAADFNARFAKAREDADKFSIDARNSGKPGGAGHAEAAAKYWEAQSAALTEGITEDSVRQRATAQLAEFGGRFRSSEYQFQEGARIGKIATDTQAASELSANRASRMHDPKAFAEEFSLGRQAIEAMPGVPDEVKDKLIKHHDEVVTVGYVDGLTRTSPAEALRQLNTGAFDELLSPTQMERARSGAEVEMRAAEAQAQAQAAIAKSQVREQLATVSARIKAGEDVPDAELVAASDAAKKIGDGSGAYKLQVVRLKNGVSKETLSWNPGQYRSEIDRLNALGEKRTAEQDIRLRQIEAIAPGRIAEFNANPAGYAARNGHPAPALNLSDPASIRARVQWTRTVSAATGRPVNPLTPDEVTDYRARLAGGPKARLEVANELAGLRLADPGAAAAAARAVAPDDAMMARIVNLRAGDRAAVIAGADARKANPALIDGKAGNDARAAFTRRVGPATSLLGQGDVGAAFDVARNLYADYAAKNGLQEFQPQIWNSFIHRALGGTKDAEGQYHGGIGTWNNVNVLLPERLSQRQFERVLTQTVWDQKGPNAPVWADGRPMTPAEVRARYVPVRRPDGRYEFHDPRTAGEGAVTKNGATWVLDIARLGTRLPK